MPALFPTAYLGHPAPDEQTLVQNMLESYPLSSAQASYAETQAAQWIQTLRNTPTRFLALETLMQEYPISSEEGLALMQLAETVLRIPDTNTMDLLIADKLHHHNWRAHTGSDHSLIGKTSGWGAWLAEHILTPQTSSLTINTLVQRLGEPMIRKAVQQALQQLGRQFVLGETIEEADYRRNQLHSREERYSFDMLGEGARSTSEAQRHFDAYRHAIHYLGERCEHRSIMENPGISIKLSALHPRYELTQYPYALDKLYERLRLLAQETKYYQMGLTIDAEESERLELSLILIERLLKEPTLHGWGGLGLAIQTYGKRILPLTQHLINLAKNYQEQLCIRLVKGAYWDSEIKRAQELGLNDYPVFTRKAHTDLAYLNAAKHLLDARDYVFPQFATHNALTIAHILGLAGGTMQGFEFQRLYGMGERIYPLVTLEHPLPCRVYAPIGVYSDLLAYLVRRMLENGANSSFVHQLSDPTIPIETLCQDPKIRTEHYPSPMRSDLPLPSQLYGTSRTNSEGLDLSHSDTLNECLNGIHQSTKPITATSLINGEATGKTTRTIISPANIEMTIGTASIIENVSDIHRAFEISAQHQPAWDAKDIDHRACCLERTADLLEKHRYELLSLLIHEAGKTLPDAINEVREAVDFCRYYASQARQHFSSQGILLSGPTGETNRLKLHGRGTWLCISPWNFPLAIFIGQIAAALASGNAVIAKPAELTPLIAYKTCQLLYEGGIPHGVLQLLIGSSKHIGSALLTAPHLSGIAFTGSTATARWLNQQLAAREGPIVPLIAETGGQNMMLVDSTALLEHACDAIITSAFRSAGQRCSALRVLWVQEEIAAPLIKMLSGAMDELRVGSPLDPATDIGPVIDINAREHLEAHIHLMTQETKLLHHITLPDDISNGHFVAPHLFELTHVSQLKEEIFGPILHLIRFKASEWESLLDHIHSSGYGLTLGLQSRIDSRIHDIANRVHVGNIYVNRSMTGAVVGVQPFGGERLSGTGPKAGGPNYLLRFAVERTLTINTTASGGNIALMSQTE